MIGTCGRPHGIRLPFVVTGDGDRRLVYAHGLGGQGALARFHTRGLVADGWCVLTYDQRGHGGSSPVTDAARYDLDEMAGDLFAVMDAAGWNRAWIGGASMGAAVSLVAALRRPERVEGLLQVAPAISGEPHPFFKGPWDPVLLRRLEEIKAAQDESTRDVVTVEADSESLKVANAKVTTWTVAGFPQIASTLACRVVVVAYEDDPIHPIDVGRALALHARHATLHVRQLAEMDDDALPAAMR